MRDRNSNHRVASLAQSVSTMVAFQWCKIEKVPTAELRFRQKPFTVPGSRFALSLVYLTTLISATLAARSEAFIGYQEIEMDCSDQLSTCQAESQDGHCLLQPYTMRVFCPASCNTGRCTSAGSMKVRHKGEATSAGTHAFQLLAEKHNTSLPANFREVQLSTEGGPLHLSSLGIGTYLGNTDKRTDEAVTSAIIHSVMNGWNVIDTASMYRSGQAEITVGLALDALLAGSSASSFPGHTVAYQSDVTRDMLFLSSKAGYEDDVRTNSLIASRRIQRKDVVDGHCIHPECLKESLATSLESMKLEKLDLLYLHNMAEAQLETVGRKVFMTRLEAAFTFLEGARTEGLINHYGMATWDCFRVPPSHASHLSLADVVAVALKVGGPGHGMRFVQLPVSAAMPEAWQQPWQEVAGTPQTLVEAAHVLGVKVVTSGPLLEAELIHSLTGRLDDIMELKQQTTTAQKLLQLVRSTPGLTGTLVGHKAKENVEGNVKLSLQPPLTPGSFQAVAKRVIAMLA